MRKFLILLLGTGIFIACETKTEQKEAAKEEAKPAAPSVALPYTANYSSQFTMDVSDQDLLTVLNSYKYWEEGDMKSLEGTLADSVTFWPSDGSSFQGTKSGLMEIWKKTRDSLSSVKVSIDAWVKLHSTDRNKDFISVWYKETDTYKSGKVDSFYVHDDNGMKNGKIDFYSQQRQALKK